MIGLTKPVTRGARAVVTGAGSGIGRAFAVELAKRGGRVVCSDIDETTAKETADLVHQAGGTAIATRCDVGSSEDVALLRDHSVDWFGDQPTLLVNNAGIGAGGHTVGHASLEEWERTLRINLWGVIHGCHHFLPGMRESGRGGVINVASAAGFVAGPRMAAYNVSKAGVMSLSETLAAELSGSGIRVTVLCPTFVKTNIFGGDLIEPSASGAASRIAAAVGMSPQKVARMALDGHDRGRLYVLPQVDARALWMSKRLTPTTHARIGGLLARVGPFSTETALETSPEGAPR